MKEYEHGWSNKFLTMHATSIDDMIAALQGAADELRAMKEAGITLDPDGCTSDDYARLVTTDARVAKQFEEKYGIVFEVDEEREEEKLYAERLISRAIKAYMRCCLSRGEAQTQPANDLCEVNGYWVFLNNVNGQLATYRYFPNQRRLRRYR